MHKICRLIVSVCIFYTCYHVTCSAMFTAYSCYSVYILCMLSCDLLQCLQLIHVIRWRRQIGTRQIYIYMHIGCLNCSVKFTMSNVDGHTIYMHIGCLNCPEFRLLPLEVGIPFVDQQSLSVLHTVYWLPHRVQCLERA